MGLQTITVIVPTLARRERATRILTALESVLTQAGVRAIPLVVVNGSSRDPELVRELAADRRIRLHSIEATGIPAALVAGRELVDTESFGELDDDDTLLPGALALRQGALEGRPEIHAVVTNGYRRNGSVDSLHIPDAAVVQRDPLGALLTSNWLLPGSWLCRTERIDAEVFRRMPRYLECTYLAAVLASRGRMLLLDHPTVVWNTGVRDSESNSREFGLAEFDALGRILELPLPPAFRSGIRRKKAVACHSIAKRHMLEGNTREAWRWHLRSITQERGWRYLLFSRRILAAMARGRPA